PGYVCLLDGSLQGSFEVHPPDANAAPAHAIEIEAIDESAQRRDSLRPVFIDVVERRARIEAALPAEGDAVAKPAAGLHHRFGESGTQTEQQTGRRAKALVLGPGEAGLVRIHERRRRRRPIEALADELAYLGDDDLAVLLVEEGV